jgi:hypothetical protein
MVANKTTNCYQVTAINLERDTGTLGTSETLMGWSHLCETYRLKSVAFPSSCKG